jgi:hypothetical protein
MGRVLLGFRVRMKARDREGFVYLGVRVHVGSYGPKDAAIFPSSGAARAARDMQNHRWAKAGRVVAVYRKVAT